MDNREFMALLEKHRHEFFCFAKRNVWNEADAEDVFCAAVTSAYENRRAFRLDTNFRAWMYKILINKCFAANRENRRQAVALDAVDEQQLARHDNPGLVPGDAERLIGDCGDEVLGGLARLRTVERSCLLLLALGGYSYREIADIVEIPSATVVTHLARGRARLREWLCDYASEHGLTGRAAAPAVEQSPKVKGGAMTNGDAMKDHPLMAYMDGQLSESDAAAFEQALTPEQKQILEADKALQGRLVGALREKDTCPDGLWRRVQDDLARKDGSARKLRVFVMVAAAACLVLGFALALVYLVTSDEPVEHTVSFAATTGQFAEMASIRGDQATIAQALKDNGFAVQIADTAESNNRHRHRVNLLGMNVIELGSRGHRCAHLRFSCCGRQVSTFVVKKSPNITPESFKPPETSRQVRKTARNVDGYLVVTMSHHPPNAVAGLFEGQAEDVSRQ